MKREIKFRAWCAKDQTMYMNVQMGIHFDDGSVYEFRHFIVPSPEDYHEWSLMEYTGLKDKDGKEIYEGDLIEIELQSGRRPAWIVEWHDKSGQWRARGITKRKASVAPSSGFWTTHSVIGNIYQNPELLK